MARRLTCLGELHLIAAAAYNANDVVQIGGRVFRVASLQGGNQVAAGDEFAAIYGESIEFPCDPAMANRTALADNVGWDAANGRVVAAGTGDFDFGPVVQDYTTGGTTVKVFIQGML